MTKEQIAEQTKSLLENAVTEDDSFFVFFNQRGTREAFYGAHMPHDEVVLNMLFHIIKNCNINAKTLICDLMNRYGHDQAEIAAWQEMLDAQRGK